MKELKLEIIKHPTCKTGFSLKHNRPGFMGTKYDHFGWHRTKADAEVMKALLLVNQNRYRVEELMAEPVGSTEVELENSGDLVLF